MFVTCVLCLFYFVVKLGGWIKTDLTNHISVKCVIRKKMENVWAFWRLIPTMTYEFWMNFSVEKYKTKEQQKHVEWRLLIFTTVTSNFLPSFFLKRSKYTKRVCTCHNALSFFFCSSLAWLFSFFLVSYSDDDSVIEINL